MNITNEENDKFVKRAVKIASVEKPGMDFSGAVMNRIEELSYVKRKPLSASPLINVKGWLLISIIIISIFSLLMFMGPTTITSAYVIDFSNYLKSIDFSMPTMSMPISISVSKIFLIGLFAFIFFFAIEISLITNRLYKVRKPV